MCYFEEIKRTPRTRLTGSATASVALPDLWTRVERFLVLGSDAGVYRAGHRNLTPAGAGAIFEALATDGPRLVRTVASIFASDRAPSHDPALLALAIASGSTADARTRALALAMAPDIARTASDLSTFVGYVRQLRGWGRGLRAAVASWYEQKSVGALAHHMTRGRQRNGWTHRDLLRVSHPQPPTNAHGALFRWAVGGDVGPELAAGAPLLAAIERARRATSADEVIRLIDTHSLPHDLVPSRWLQSAEVWEALLGRMTFPALLEHLGAMTAAGVLAHSGAATALATLRLTDADRIRRSRVHPVTVLSALAAYRRGRGTRRRLHWKPVSAVVDALEEAFHLSFENAPAATGKRIYLAISASSSMESAMCAGLPHVSAGTAAAALAMSVVRTESQPVIAAFHDRVWQVDIGPLDRLDHAIAAIAHQPRGADARVPVEDALRRGIPVDAFVLVTDSPARARSADPMPALARYRRSTGIPAKLVMIGMASRRYTSPESPDAGRLDVAGFDATVPAVAADFIRH